MTINLGANHGSFCFAPCKDPVVTVMPSDFRSRYWVGLVVYEAVRMRERVPHIDKRCPLYASYTHNHWILARTPTHLNFPLIFPLPTISICNFRAHRLQLPQNMSSHSQATGGPSSTVIPLSSEPVLIFELNQARRAKVTRELEALRGSTCSEFDFRETFSFIVS